ncbi:hypothetical protein PUNSTDRAFT_47797 [Punctularia strigosozonata HHB-11173 SS5]|uniref:Uncharacterized protein n=1 Tax=Punctularia strigosozonata (strain HHB-11173) TaxID=741275 RepID=R7S2D2_PUNST|nr:uncharacterized protein PUNSTDRAFT_47797 [Punctularia strigosozonata HHB-11173 SS5]EIN04014.1 hypothetical protein PUNSTDRAFT_47797 [Punctularia strigosozonata HHB-11173 SS5]
MPTVPPVPVAPSPQPIELLANATPDILPDDGDDRNDPTPDPETDDVVMMPAITGESTAISISGRRRTDFVDASDESKLSSIKFHSPSSILGTPFESESRFEYPFPSSDGASTSSDSTVVSPLSDRMEWATPASSTNLPSPPITLGLPALPALTASPAPHRVPMPHPLALHLSTLSLHSGSGSGAGTWSAPTTVRPGPSRALSPAHTKLAIAAREPPMPPSLLKKRKRLSAGLALPRLRGSTISTPQVAYAEQESSDARVSAVTLTASLSIPELDLTRNPLVFAGHTPFEDTDEPSYPSLDPGLPQADGEPADHDDRDVEENPGLSRRCFSLPPET